MDRATAVLELVERVPVEELISTRELRQSMLFDIVVIGEALGQVSKQVQSLEPDVPWRVVSDTRNRFIHRYWQIDVIVLREIVIRDLPLLANALGRLVEILDRELRPS